LALSTFGTLAIEQQQIVVNHRKCWRGPHLATFSPVPDIPPLVDVRLAA
jgi:hypothetical protein